MLKAYLPLFNHVYNTYGGTHKVPGQKTFMTVDEFVKLVTEGGFVNDLFVSRDTSLCFNLAMMTQINEIESERHQRATFIEFLEAFARVAERASLAPISENE